VGNDWTYGDDEVPDDDEADDDEEEFDIKVIMEGVVESAPPPIEDDQTIELESTTGQRDTEYQLLDT